MSNPDSESTSTGSGPGASTVPAAGIVFILILMLTAAVFSTWTLSDLLGRVPEWELRNDTLAVMQRNDTAVADQSDTVAMVPVAPAESGASRRVTSSVATRGAVRDSTGGTPGSTRDTLILQIVLVAGALGGLLHGVRSFAWYVGNRDLRWSWVPTYVTLPVVGAMLAAVIYLVVRAGFVGFTEATAPSPYGFAAAAALVGLFSQPAILKLKEVAETLFTKPEPGEDSTPQNDSEVSQNGQKPHHANAGMAPRPVITSGTLSRDNGKRLLRITGSGFREVTTLEVNRTPVKVASVGPRELVAILEDELGLGPVREVTVTTPPPGGGTSSHEIEDESATKDDE